MSELCDVAWPCGSEASFAMKVFGTKPRYACSLHERELRAKGAEFRPLAKDPGPWVVEVEAQDGRVLPKAKAAVKR